MTNDDLYRGILKDVHPSIFEDHHSYPCLSVRLKVLRLEQPDLDGACRLGLPIRVSRTGSQGVKDRSIGCPVTLMLLIFRSSRLLELQRIRQHILLDSTRSRSVLYTRCSVTVTAFCVVQGHLVT